MSFDEQIDAPVGLKGHRRRIFTPDRGCFENDFTSFRYALTKETLLNPALAIVFTIDENKNVVLERVEVLT